jgi:hypothetical protein
MSDIKGSYLPTLAAIFFWTGMNNVDRFVGRHSISEFQKDLDNLASGLHKLATIGAMVLKWDMERDTPGREELIPGLLFLRNQIELIESISVLLQSALTDPCKLLLRTSFETQLQLEYLLGDDQDRRGACFIVWNAHKSISTYKKSDGVSEEYKQLKAKFDKDRFAKGSAPKILENAQRLIDNDMTLLNKDEYKTVNAEYLRLKKEKKKKITWFSLFNGPADIEGLAAHCNLQATYEILYRSWSNFSHGTDIMRGKISQNELGHLQVCQIRNPLQAEQVALHCFNFGLLTFDTFVKKRVIHKQKEFLECYRELASFHEELNKKR